MDIKKVYQRIILLVIITVGAMAVLNWTSSSESESMQEWSGFAMGVAIGSSLGVIGLIIYALLKREN